MKVNNKKKTINHIRILVLFIVVMLFINVAIWMLEILNWHNSYGFLVLLFCFGIEAVLLWRLFSVKYFDYEHSGEVISIKYYSPWKIGRIVPEIELPVNKLASYEIQKSNGLAKLCLVVNGSNGKISFRYILWNISQQQINIITDSLRVS